MKPFEVRFDLYDVVLEFGLRPEEGKAMARAAVEAVTLEIFRNWQQEARTALRSTRFTYLRGLQVLDLGELKKAIVLNGKLPNMLESGASAFDMKAGFAKSSKVKFNKEGGWYLTIPFRMGTPGIVGESEVFSSIMPDEIYRLIRMREGAMTALGGGKSSAPALGVKDLPTKYQAPDRRPAIFDKVSGKFAEYQHKTSIYAGISKSTGMYEKTSGNSYNSFRRAGQNSDPLSWIHRGIQAYNLADKALQSTDIRTVVDNTVDATLANLGFSS